MASPRHIACPAAICRGGIAARSSSTSDNGSTPTAEIGRGRGGRRGDGLRDVPEQPTLLHRAWDLAVGGDERDVHLLDRPEVRAGLAEPELPERLARFAEVNTAIMRRAGRGGRRRHRPRRGHAAGGDRRCAVRGDGGARRAGRGHRQLAVPVPECRDIPFARTGGSLWRNLVDRRG